ncbi:hypothetical protein IHE44_0012759 [Lamprotornis superbus]|uniref:Uncharacterized protein n=1 Tax=Lamprotornis superbus TaxID=245042 RepID=A0A835NFW2_9PASS|nr:hypothetical protein IHE44_0012759 [Lamprotornis superbus]
MYKWEVELSTPWKTAHLQEFWLSQMEQPGRSLGSKEGAQDPRKEPKIQGRSPKSKEGAQDPRKEPKIQGRSPKSKEGAQDPRKEPKIQGRSPKSKEGAQDPRKEPGIQDLLANPIPKIVDSSTRHFHGINQGEGKC